MAKQKLKILDRTPAQLGYTFPPEWYPHAATWFSWPRPEGISFPGKYHTIPENLARIMCQIQSREQVHINVPNENWEYIVRQQLTEHGCPTTNVFFHYIKTNESWCRDHGPAFVVKRAAGSGQRAEFDKLTRAAGSGQTSTSSLEPRAAGGGRQAVAVIDWGFNAWGGKYPPYEDDDAVPTRIAEELKLPVFYPRVTAVSRGGAEHAEHARDARVTVVMEGGSVDFNGAGTILTTTSCLLNKNRNPKLSKKKIEQYLKDYYGQKHVIWLGEGIIGDDTDGHIDDLARFIGPRTIAFAVEEDPKDENYQILKENRKLLDTLRDQDGLPFEAIELPMPGVVEHDGQRLPATYMNFYFINGALLVPTYRNKKSDRKAIDILQRQLPHHKVIGIDCTELIWGLGAIHCLTQQQPKV